MVVVCGPARYTGSVVFTSDFPSNLSDQNINPLCEREREREKERERERERERETVATRTNSH